MKPPRVTADRMSDFQLELYFPEHKWREPVPVRWVEERSRRSCRVFGCAFCLYRKGLLGPYAARRLATSEQVFEHLAREHPPGVSLSQAP